jgi:hypothetical protein
MNRPFIGCCPVLSSSRRRQPATTRRISIETPGMLSPEEPPNEAVPQASRRELRHESGGPIGERRVHDLLQDGGTMGSTARRSPSPFGSAYGLLVHVGWLMRRNLVTA